jgi:hypothetical protein
MSTGNRDSEKIQAIATKPVLPIAVHDSFLSLPDHRSAPLLSRAGYRRLIPEPGINGKAATVVNGMVFAC